MMIEDISKSQQPILLTFLLLKNISNKSLNRKFNFEKCCARLWFFPWSLHNFEFLHAFWSEICVSKFIRKYQNILWFFLYAQSTNNVFNFFQLTVKLINCSFQGWQRKHLWKYMILKKNKLWPHSKQSLTQFFEKINVYANPGLFFFDSLSWLVQFWFFWGN